MDNDTVLTTKEATEYLRISRVTLLKYIRLGRVNAVKAGRGWKIYRSELLRFLNIDKWELNFRGGQRVNREKVERQFRFVGTRFAGLLIGKKALTTGERKKIQLERLETCKTKREGNYHGKNDGCGTESQGIKRWTWSYILILCYPFKRQTCLWA